MDDQGNSETDMNDVAVLIPAGTVVRINDVPVRLSTSTIVETAYWNMRLLTGHHYACLHRIGTETIPTPNGDLT